MRRLAPAVALALAVLACVAPGLARAAPSIEARVARSRVAVGEPVGLDLVVGGVSGGISEPDLILPSGIEIDRKILSDMAIHEPQAFAALVAKAKGARFVIASTSEVYGDPLEHPQTETYWGNVNPVGPRGVYDEAKRFAEAMTVAYHRYHGVDAKIVRIFNTYGPRMRVRDGRAVPNFIGQALKGEDVTVYGDGSQTRSLCYVSDLVDGVIRLMLSSANEPINIGNPQELTIEEIARTILRLTGSSSRIARAAPHWRASSPELTWSARRGLPTITWWL